MQTSQQILEKKRKEAVLSALENFLAAIACECGVTWTSWQVRVTLQADGIPTLTLRGAGSAIRLSLDTPYWESYGNWQNRLKGKLSSITIGKELVDAWKRRSDPIKKNRLLRYRKKEVTNK